MVAAANAIIVMAMVVTIAVVVDAAPFSDPSEYFGGINIANNPTVTSSYLEWIQTPPISNWTSHTFLSTSSDANVGAALHWHIDTISSTIEIAVATQALGWTAVGFSRTGGMLGSDLFLVEAHNLSLIKDMHVLDTKATPQLDDCQNWELIRANVTDDGYFLVHAKRLLDTGDNQDLILHNDGDLSYPISFVIAAWGSDDEHVAYHGPQRARSGIRWFRNGESEQALFEALMQSENAQSFFVGATNHSIKTQETEYAYFCVSAKELEDMGVNMKDGMTLAGFDTRIDNVQHVHHFVFYGSYDKDLSSSSCDVMTTRESQIVYLWGPGEPPYAFPANVGMPLGGGGANESAGAFQSFVLQIHYDNLYQITNQSDSSGVLVYYVPEPKEFIAGVYNSGDPFLGLYDEVIPAGISDYLFECPGTCSSILLADQQPVTVLREYLHMHRTGYAMYNEQIRDGETIRTSAVDYFDFQQSGGPAPPQEPFQILPGDSFKTRCYYKNAPGSNVTFGEGSQQEMCMSFILYYPRKMFTLGDFSIPWYCGVGFGELGFSVCETNVTKRVLEVDETPERRTFGTPGAVCTGIEITSDDDSLEEDADEDDENDATSGSIRATISASLVQSLFWKSIFLSSTLVITSFS